MDARTKIQRLLTDVVLPFVALASSYWLIARPILSSPYWGDDIGDSQIPMYLARTQTTFLTWVLEQTQASSAATGRFFPISIANASAVYVLFDTREAYKIYQFAILALALCAVSAFAGLALRSRWAAYATCAVGLLTVQMKEWFDPYWQFAGQQSVVAILTAGAFSAAILSARAMKTRTAVALAAGGLLLFTAAEFTYEQTIFLLPAVAFLLVRETGSRARRAAIFGSFALVSAALLANLAFQRSRAVVEAPAYTLSFAPGATTRTFVNQATNAIPLSYQWLTRRSVLPADAAWPVEPIVMALIAVVFAAGAGWIGLNLLRLRRDGLWWFVGAAGVWWAVPSAFVAISARWQAEVAPGRGYIPVLVGGMAVALITAASIIGLGRFTSSAAGLCAPWRRNPVPLIAIAVTLGIGAAGILVLTATNNANAVRFPPVLALQAERDAFAQSIEDGLFDEIPDDAVIIRPVFNPWEWQNPDFTAWYGASPNLRFITPEEYGTVDCGGADSCYRIVQSSPEPGQIAYSIEPY